MIKTFRELLAEKDDEFAYRLHSTANIHRPELFERIKLSFMPYNIKSIETESYKPIGRFNKLFPEEPNSPTYTIRIVTAFKVPREHLQTVAMEAHIHIAHLRLEGEQDIELVNKPEEIDGAQKLVGTKRIADFIKELQSERREREKQVVEREVYESFLTTHRGLEDILHKPVCNGYYKIDLLRENDKTYLSARGPFAERTDDQDYRDRIKLNATLLHESNNGDEYSVEMLIDAKNIK